jgi:NDP-sugar pyrophosphorylase family protein
MKAVLLAAGLGTRLAPMTDSIPKALAPLGGRPLLERQLAYLAREGVTEVGVNVHHHADRVLEFLHRDELPVAVHISHEPELLGTAGALHGLRRFGLLDEPFLVLYGDVATDASLGSLRKRHDEVGGIATLAYYRDDAAEGKGVLSLATDGRVEAFVEKPAAATGPVCINAGLYLLDPRIRDYVPHGFADFGLDVFPAALAAGEAIFGHELDGYLRDVGSPESLRAAEEDLAEGALQW